MLTYNLLSFGFTRAIIRISSSSIQLFLFSSSLTKHDPLQEHFVDLIPLS